MKGAVSQSKLNNIVSEIRTVTDNTIKAWKLWKGDFRAEFNWQIMLSKAKQ